MTLSPLVEAAGDYLTRGLQVIALTGKTPNVTVHRRGLHEPVVGAPESEEDWEVVRRVFEHPDTTGIGILTSWPLIVVDLDSEVGAQNWLALVGEGQLMPGSWVARTRKGVHLYYASIQRTGTFKPFGNDGGVDLKADGGYVAAPPSVHPDGGQYSWVRPPGAALSEAPGALEAAIKKHLQRDAFATKRRAATKANRKAQKPPEYKPGDAVFYAQSGYTAVIEGMKKAAEGNRNHYLHWAAATLAEEGATEEDFDELAGVALKAGLEAVEIERTLRSGRSRGGG